MSDLDLDEYGIYRENLGGNEDNVGLDLDEDGIWHDDATSFHKRLDSGLGTAERRSASSIAQPLDGQEAGYTEEDYIVDAYAAAEKSLNISELEASESLSFDQGSLASDLDFPELNYGSDIATDDQIPDFDSDGDPAGRGHLWRAEIGGRWNRGRRRKSGDNAWVQRTMKKSAPAALSEASIGYLLEPAGRSVEGKPLPQAHEGDSLFTQDDVLLPVQQHSLLEFEQLEEVCDSDLSEEEDADLIGSYLQGLQEQESKEDATGDHTEDSLLDQQQPPFNNSSFTLDVTTDLSRADTSWDLGAAGSRIPVLRSRSPSMSRPGSASRRPSSRQEGSASRYSGSEKLSGSVPSTPERSRSRTRPPEKRTLPQPPSDPSSRSPSQGRAARHGRLLPSISRSVSNSPARSKSPAVAEDNSLNHSRLIDRVLNDSDAPAESHDTSSANSSRRRPRSAEQIRAAASLPKDLKPKKSATPDSPAKFRIRSNSSGNTRLPLKAIRSDSGASATQANDSTEHNQNEETLAQLQQEYHNLLQKYAEAENTIDSLRIGAKIPLNVDVSTTGRGTPASLQPGRAGSIVSISPAPTHIGLPGAMGSRPPSRTSQLSVGQWSAAAAPPPPLPLPDRDQEAATSQTSGEGGPRQSILSKAQAVQEQMSAFSILLAENHLSAEEQEQALQNIKQSYEALQTAYQDARLSGRRSSLAIAGSVDDEQVAGEIYKVSMMLDGLESQVQDTLKQSSSQRKPFQSAPVKADHSLGGSMDSGQQGRSSSPGLSPHRPSSVGSSAGGPQGVDNELHRLNKEYDLLMDHYRRLRQAPRSLRRDQKVEKLLKQLRAVYEAIPEHRKPALPPELENRYSSLRGSFVPGSSNSDPGKDHYRSTVRRDSQISSPRTADILDNESSPRYADHPESQHSPDSSSAEPTPRIPISLPHRHPKNVDYSSTSDSLRSGPIRASDLRRQETKTRTPLTMGTRAARRREMDEKDSGYVGSELSRGMSSNNRLAGKERLAPERRGSRLSASHSSSRSAKEPSQVDDFSSSDDRSTVEYRKVTRQSPSSRTKTYQVAPTSHVTRGPSEISRKRTLAPRGSVDHRPASSPGPQLHRRLSSSSSSGSCSSSGGSDSESDSIASVTMDHHSIRSSAKSDEIKQLRAEIKRLKQAPAGARIVIPTSSGVAMTPVVLAAPGTASVSSIPAYYSAAGASGEASRGVMVMEGERTAGGSTSTPGYVLQTGGGGAATPGYMLQSAGGGAATPGYVLQSAGGGAATPGYVLQSAGVGSAANPGYVLQSAGVGSAANPGYVLQGSLGGAAPQNYVLQQGAAAGAATPGYVLGSTAHNTNVPAYNAPVHPAAPQYAANTYAAAPYSTGHPGYRSGGAYHQRAPYTSTAGAHSYQDRSPHYYTKGRPQYPHNPAYSRGHDDQTRLKRLRDYYIPSRQRTAPVPHHHPAAAPAQWPPYPAAVGAQPAPAAFPVQPPAYQQVAAGCAWPAQPSGIVNPVAANQPVLLATTASPNVVPVQLVTTEISSPSVNKSRVRYYVREYGSDTEAVTHKNRTRGNTSRKACYFDMERDSSQSDAEDLNNSLDSALRTAGHLKVMSKTLRSNLKDELRRS